ncbi:hypothetical protein MTR67_006137 [Solanum verrucosum]|uniref:Uncharacterized protein n=1 Tax=Solanum verrucosum TaxID=315347 RepID=A0AAF0PXP9_SOLVR|nr:hypothetical protein MTR67_006137 [Solanum verrucosum]
MQAPVWGPRLVMLFSRSRQTTNSLRASSSSSSSSNLPRFYSDKLPPSEACPFSSLPPTFLVFFSFLKNGVNDDRLRTAGEASQRSTKEEWAEWMRHFSIELLKESPYLLLGGSCFAAGFVSCWSQLNEASQRQLVRSLQMALSSPNIPPEILATLLNLIIRLLGALAEKAAVGILTYAQQRLGVQLKESCTAAQALKMSSMIKFPDDDSITVICPL